MNSKPVAERASSELTIGGLLLLVLLLFLLLVILLPPRDRPEPSME